MTLKLDGRQVVIGVDSIVGLMNLELAQLGALPPLLRNVSADLMESFGSLDAQLLLVLRAARIVPDEVWATLAQTEAARNEHMVFKYARAQLMALIIRTRQ